jgi:hypothetical protein
LQSQLAKLEADLRKPSDAETIKQLTAQVTALTAAMGTLQQTAAKPITPPDVESATVKVTRLHRLSLRTTKP